MASGPMRSAIGVEFAKSQNNTVTCFVTPPERFEKSGHLCGEVFWSVG